MSKEVVIVGAGQAGLTAAVALRDSGWEGHIRLIGAEDRLPYQRPPLSKGYLAGSETASDLLLRSAEALERDRIDIHLGVEVTSVDRRSRTVNLSTGECLIYDTLILATGSNLRTLRVPGSDLDGVHLVRTVQDSDALRDDFADSGATVFIGGGFLNLEVAAEAVKHGSVTVLEVAPQILGRVLSPETAAALAEYHQGEGITIRCGVEVAELSGSNGRVTGVTLADGEVIPADRVVVSVGTVANDSIARACRLPADGGIIVDSRLRTIDPHIFAIGDCARHPNAFAQAEMRVESVQNATDQARHVAGQIVHGHENDYMTVPWFWSAQGTQRLQIAGIARPDDGTRIAERGERGKLVVERLRDGRVSAVETINAPGAHMKARRALAEFPELYARIEISS